MAKTEEKLNELKEEELQQVAGGMEQGKPIVIHSRCDCCESCVDICPMMVIHCIDGVIVIGDDCVPCGNCVNICPAGALK